MNALALLVAYGLMSFANVAAVAVGAATLTTATKAVLMPLLLAWLLLSMQRAGSRSPALRWLGVGLVFAWFGDLLLSGQGDLYFMAGLGAFLVMQVCYIVSFQRVPGPGLVRAWKIAAVPYVLVWLVMNVVLSAGVGDLRIPVLVYSAVLMTMAAAALDLVIRVPRAMGWRIAIGAGLFVVSDAILALTHFGPLSSSSVTSVAVMTTYLVAQAMIVTGMAGALLRTEASASATA